jgi:UDP-N-acetylmuramate dehydrogenase
MLNLLRQIPLASQTTFKIGGSARFFAEVHDESEIVEAIEWAKQQGVPYAILGGGSNMLVSDEGYDGLVIKISCASIIYDGDLVSIDAGRNLLQTIRDTAEKSLGGWDKLAGIPGTVGGAARGNAGAFGSELKDFVTYVRALDTSSGEFNEFANAECSFSYRNSFFKQHPQYLITLVQVKLAQVEKDSALSSIEATIAEREKRHLQNVRAAGSFFMNPTAPAEVVALFEREKGVKAREGRVPAGWLIEKAGFKGATYGGAQASMQHPNYLVNASGEATSAEVLELADTIKEAVREQFGVELSEEAAYLV